MMSLGTCATLACLWEATAAKPGNVYRGADFEDLTYADFVTSAAVIGPIVDHSAEQGVGPTIHHAVAATRAAVATNTNLGMLLLMVPLAAVPRKQNLASGIESVLNGLTVADTREVYAAIRLAQPGGLGKADAADVHETPPELPLVEVMQLAAERDSIARQYANGFREVFQAADLIAAALAGGNPLGDAIIKGHVQLLAEHPDTLIARKCGADVAREASQRAARVLVSEDYLGELADFDFWLRADAHRRNPGTTADLTASGLFVLLREDRLDWPVRFYSRVRGAR